MADVIVVGGGIIGLTAAVRLRAAGADVEVWSADDPLGTVSAVAAAVWYPTRTAFSPRVLDWAAAAYDEFTRQAAAGRPGVLLRRTRNVGVDGPAPWWAPAAGDVTVRGAEVTFTAPLVEMARYLPWLSAQVRFVRRRVAALDEALAAAPVVVNATGLGAGALAGDPAVHPVRGQIVLVENPGLDESLRTPDAYVHPRRGDVVLGGTFEAGARDTTPDPDTRAAILARCRSLVPALAGARLLADRVGLRPARDGGPRVEAVAVPGGTVVHAYGHGGAGMTLSWGCAAEVAQLCDRNPRENVVPMRQSVTGDDAYRS
jgi:D-amino-acid oxidase